MNALYWPLLVLAALALLVTARPTSADPRAKAEAKQHMDRAAALHAQGKFAQALDELKTAFSLDPRPELLYAMGQIHVSLGECPQAITYYQRYLATGPDPDTASVVTEAIEACASNPPPAAATSPATADSPAVTAPPALTDPPAVTAPPAVMDHPVLRPARPAASVAAERAWYGDPVADALVASGIAATIVGMFEYRSAVQDRDRADAATSYQRYVDLVDQAQGRRAAAVVVGVAGVALAAAGGLHYVWTGRRARQTLSISASGAGGGGVVSLSGRFR